MAIPALTQPRYLSGAKGTLLEYVINNPQGTREGKIVIDAVTDEQHQATVEVTKYPVQTGFIVSDHLMRRNRIITLRGIISNYDYSLMDEVTSFENFSDAIQDMREKQATENSNKLYSGFNTLNDICLLGGKTTIYTMIGTYQNCILNNVQSVKNAKLGNALEVVLTFEEITEVTQKGVRSYKLGEPEEVTEKATNNKLDKHSQKKGGRA